MLYNIEQYYNNLLCYNILTVFYNYKYVGSWIFKSRDMPIWSGVRGNSWYTNSVDQRVARVPFTPHKILSKRNRTKSKGWKARS